MEYKEKLRLAKEALDSGSYDKETIEYIFPELKESEDEKIRKAIIKLVRQSSEVLDKQNQNNMINWLEKQKEYESTDFEYVWDRTDCGDLTSALDKYSKEAIINMCHAWYDKGIELERKAWLKKQGNLKSDEWKEGDVVRNGDILALVTNGRKVIKSNRQQMTIQYPDAWVKANSNERKYFFDVLEKQGEQKPYGQRKECLDCQFNYAGECKGSCQMKRDEQKPIIEMKSAEESLGISSEEYNDIVNECLYGESESSDKVELKFKVGDWITNGDYTWKIVEVKPLDYILQSQDGNIVDDTISHVDEQFHSFAIEDAKDGDVLVDEDNNIGIYKEIEGICWHSYIYLGCDNRLYGFSIGGSHMQSNTKPATKEQCDTLFAKMKAEGYEWPEETHELKEIKQKSAWSEEDMKEALRTEYEKGRADTIAEIGGNFIEDDSEEFDIAIETLKEAGQFSSAKWLESIKDRIQPKHEWRDEDENGLGDALWAIKQARTIAKDENDMGNLWYAENWLNTNFD